MEVVLFLPETHSLDRPRPGLSPASQLPAVSQRRGRIFRPTLRLVAGLGAGLLAVLLSGCGSLCLRRLPPGVYIQGSVQPACGVRFLGDLTFLDCTGARQSEQCIFNDILALIAGAQTFVVADMFLYNTWAGLTTHPYRPLTREFTEALLDKKRTCPECVVLLITDPINTAYGGAPAPHLDALREAGVIVVETDLDKLRDSNPLYSLFWRLLVRPFGNSPGGVLPNPFDGGRVTLRTYLRMLNFKANHRKVVIADPGGVPTAVITSANPHDGSSAHSNTAVRFGGPAVLELLEVELAVAAFSGSPVALTVPTDAAPGCTTPTTAQVVTERSIQDAVLAALDQAGPGDEVDLVMFYLSDRRLIKALAAAHRRGATLRLVLDPNKDAFGRQKGGIPNRQVARELRGVGVPLRWYDTHGEQCHTKMLLVRYAGRDVALILGSANYTRRNLDNFNLETDVVIRGPPEVPVLSEARQYVDTLWHNLGGRHCTVDYERYGDPAWHKYWRYRLMEATGISTF